MTTNDELLRRADELLDDYVDCEFYPMGADAVIRDLAAALRELDGTVRYVSAALDKMQQRAERAEADLFQARQAAFQEGMGRAAVGRERDALRVRVTRLEGAIDRLHDFVVSETDYDLHEVTDYVNTVRWREAYAALDKEGK